MVALGAPIYFLLQLVLHHLVYDEHFISTLHFIYTLLPSSSNFLVLAMTWGCQNSSNSGKVEYAWLLGVY